jgi:hypothetical protein
MTIRGWIALAAMLLAAPGLRAQAAAPDTLPADTAAPNPVRDFVYDLADPLALANAGAMGLYDHIRVDPYDWGGGMDALVQRIASRAGGHLVGTSVRHGLAAALGRSTRDEPCLGCASAEDRINHALIETFTDRDAGGRRVISEPFLAGAYAGAIVPTLWHPDSTLGDGLVSGTISVLFSAATEVLFALLEPMVRAEQR